MYRQWREGWYGNEPQRRWLAFCAERFTSLEIDGTFYGSKPRSVFEKWAEQVPPGFRFAVRGHRYVTHYRRFKDVRESIVRLKDSAEGLGEKLGPILWQTPPKMSLDEDRLRSFVEDLRVWDTARHVLEFRHDSWFIPSVKKILQDANVAIGVSDGEGIPLWSDVSADFAYVRLHGRPLIYRSDYSGPQLRAWLDRVCAWRAEEAYIYFDNDVEGHAPHNAVNFLEKLREGEGGNTYRT